MVNPQDKMKLSIALQDYNKQRANYLFIIEN